MTTPDPVLPDPARSRAVLIAVSEYHRGGLASYPALAEGARQLAELLKHPDVWGLAAEHCTVLTDAAHTDEEAILDAVDAAAREAKDTLVIYFSGHGVTWQGQYWLAHSRARPGDCSRWLSWKRLRSRLADSQTAARHRIVVLDACESAAAINEGPPEGDAALLASCSGTERSWAPPGNPFATYTGALVEIIRCGDVSREAVFSPDALHQAVRRHLSGKADQSPDFQSRGEGGHLPLLRNRASSTTSCGPEPRPTNRSRLPQRVALVVALAAVAAILTTLITLVSHAGRDDDDRDTSSPSVEPSTAASPSAAAGGEQDVPTALEAARSKCAPSSDKVRLGDDGYTLIIERATAKQNPGIDRKTLDCIFDELDVPDWVVSRIETTTGFSGQQEADFNGFSAFWTYQTDRGLHMIISQNRS